jgi:hypothetical protein
LIRVFSDTETFDLLARVGRAVAEAFKNPSQSEPQLVANLVWHVPNAINSVAWGGPTNVKAGGIFVHAQPFAASIKFPQKIPESVELGDLLLLRTLCRAGEVIERRALLLQAKKAPSLPAKPDNENQHYLYAHWPSFEYAKRSGELTEKPRSVRGPDLYNGAKYLLLAPESSTAVSECCWEYPFTLWDPKFTCCRMSTAQPTMPELSHYECFTKELVEFICGDRGKPFVNPPPRRKRGWDKVMHDLIEQTAQRKSAFMKRASIGSGKRGVCTEFVIGLESVGSLSRERKPSLIVSQGGDAPPEVPPEVTETISDGGDGGISVIEFVVNANERQGE